MERKKILARVKEKGLSVDGAKYDVKRELGDGGNGLVLLCNDPQGKSVVAKLYVPPDGRDLDEREYLRFDREVQLSLSLDHPNIVRGLGSGVVTLGSFRVPFYLMPLAQSTLKDIVKQPTGPDTLERKLRTFVRILLGVACLHNNGVYHRDLKPANILIDQHGNPWVADLGIAHAGSKFAGQTLHTTAGDKLRNQDYYAPEQRFGTSEVDHRSDIYALGYIFYELISGIPPLRHPAPSLESIDEGFAPFDKVVNKMIAFDPKDRYQCLEDAIEDLAVTIGWVLATYKGARPPEASDLQSVVKLMKSSNDAHRQRGIELAIRLGKESLVTLYELLGHTRREVRNAAATALGTIGDPQSLPYLVAGLYGVTTRVSVFRASADTADASIASYPVARRLEACSMIQKPVRPNQIVTILRGVPKEQAIRAAQDLLQKNLVLLDYGESPYSLLLQIDEETAWPDMMRNFQKLSDFKVRSILHILSETRRVDLLYAWADREPQDAWYFKYMVDDILTLDLNRPGMRGLLERLLLNASRWVRYPDRDNLTERIREAIRHIDTDQTATSQHTP